MIGHLEKAAKCAGRKNNFFYYCYHAWIAIIASAELMYLGIMSFIHAIFPCIYSGFGLAKENSPVKKMIVICGHYKGIDERVIEKYVTHEYSIGDFVVTNGEIPAMIIIDSEVRLVPGVINNIESALTDSFAMDLLDSPCYTQPRDIDGLSVPEVLLSGNHKEIAKWKQACRAKRTEEKRPDMWNNYI